MSCQSVIKRIRTKLYLQQDELAKELGVSKSTVCNYESGRRMPKLRTARKIKEYADSHDIAVDMDELLRAS